MNPHDSRDPWSRLTAAARNARDERDERAPYGFATRVAALAGAAERRAGSLLERFAFRAVGAASLLAALSVALNYSALARPERGSNTAPVEEVALPFDEAIAAALDFSE